MTTSTTSEIRAQLANQYFQLSPYGDDFAAEIEGIVGNQTVGELTGGFSDEEVDQVASESDYATHALNVSDALCRLAEAPISQQIYAALEAAGQPYRREAFDCAKLTGIHA